MYLVLSISNHRNSTVAVVAPRIITPNAPGAFRVARKALEKDSYFLSSVVIYEVMLQEEYSLADSSGNDEYPSKTIVCTMWMNGEEVVTRYWKDFELKAKS